MQDGERGGEAVCIASRTHIHVLGATSSNSQNTNVRRPVTLECRITVSRGKGKAPWLMLDSARRSFLIESKSTHPGYILRLNLHCKSPKRAMEKSRREWVWT